jgi:hypothetical protein
MARLLVVVVDKLARLSAASFLAAIGENGVADAAARFVGSVVRSTAQCDEIPCVVGPLLVG